MITHDTLIQKLKAENQELRERVASLEKENQELKERLASIEKKLDNMVKPPPSYIKPNVRSRRKKSGGQRGHKGVSRTKPQVINDEMDVTLTCCPHCQNVLGEPIDSHPHIVEDIPCPRMEVTKYNILRYWCNQCKRKVSSKPSVVKPKTPFGNNLNVMVSLLRSLGLTVGKIRDIMLIQYGLRLSEATILRMEETVADAFNEDYQAIKDHVRDTRVKYVDETSWRVNGQNHWLWGADSDEATFYSVEPGRGSADLVNALGGNPEGIMVSDMYSAYNPFDMFKQKCLVHLLRELREVKARVKRPSREFVLFERRVKRMISDAVKVWSSDLDSQQRYEARRLFEKRVENNHRRNYSDQDCKRISKTMFKHLHELFLFVEHADVEWHNNRAERALRPAVIMRKNSYGSRSVRGAKNRAIIMTMLQTLKKQGLDYFQVGQQRLAMC